MHCTRCHKLLNRLTMQLVVNNDTGELEIVCFDDRLCEVRQVKYKSIHKVRQHAQRFAKF